VTASSAVGEWRCWIDRVCSDHGEIHAERRSLTDFTFYRNGATVVLHESMDDGQSKSRSFDSPGGEERLECSIHRRPRHANAGVLHGDTNILARMQLTARSDFAFGGVNVVQGQRQDASGRHGLSGIRAEIHQN